MKELSILHVVYSPDWLFLLSVVYCALKWEKILVFHNFTKAVELAENVTLLESYYTWQWKVEAADAEGWSKISNPDGLYLTSKLTGKSSKLAVEKEGKLKKKK